MAYKRIFNPFTKKFDIVQNLSTLTWKDPVDTYEDLPTTGNNENDARFVRDTDKLYVWTIPQPNGSLSDWKEIGSLSGVAPHGETHLPDGSDPVYTVIYEDNGKIGIGVLTPEEKLDVDGNVKVNGAILANFVNRVASKIVNEGTIGDGKALVYNASEDRIEYVTIARYLADDDEIEIFAI